MSLSLARTGTACLALIWMLPVAVASASPRGFEDFDRATWSLESGLPQRSVMAIAQDQGRYLWLGTQHGLTRFDGLRFREYAVEDHPELAGNDITSLLNDADDRLWIGTRKGLSVRNEDGFREIVLPVEDRNGGDVVVAALLETAGGDILVGTNQGLFRIEGDDPRQATALLSERIGGLAQIDGQVWIGGLGRYWTSLSARDEPSEQGLPESLATVLITDFLHRPDAVWAATTGGLYRLGDEEAARVDLHPGLSKTPITAMLTDRRDETWIATEQALFRLRRDDAVEHIDNSYPLYHPQIQALFEDRAGNLWMGSSVDGLARFRAGRADRYSRPEGLSETLTWSLASGDEASLWVGTADGLSRLENGRFEPVLAGDQLPHPHVYTLHVEGERLWIGTRRGLVRFEPATARTERPESLSELDAFQINGIVPAGRHGRIFFLTGNGLYLWHADDRLEHLDAVIGSRSVRQLRALPDDSLLVATESGVFRGEPGRWRALDEGHGLPADLTAMAAHVADSQRVVVGSMDRGLFIGDGDRFRRLGRADGLPSDSSYFITHDRHGFAWVAGFEGVYRVALDELFAPMRDENPGIEAEMLISESGQHRGSQQGYCCNGAGHAKGLLRDDGLWLPTRDGVIRLRPEDVDSKRLPPALHLERARIGTRWTEPPSEGPLQPPLGERNIAFEFAAISLADPLGVRVRYRLEGFHGWRELNAIEQPRVEYTNLPPEQYRFEIEGQSTSGTQAKERAGMTVEIPPRFRETPAFYALVLLGAAGLIGLAYLWRKRQWRLRQRMLEEEVARQTEALRESNAQLQDANRALKRLSERDSLTGLHNRRHLERRMPREVKRLERRREQAGKVDPVIGFALIDVDHFKAINDRIGHGAGDRILEEIGLRLRQRVRETDYAVRWGGEEFLIVMPDQTREDAPAAVERLHAGLRDCPYAIDDHRNEAVTVSVGYAELPHGTQTPVSQDDWETVVELADRALYQVKQHGRDGWAILRPGSDLTLDHLIQALRTDPAACIARGDVHLDIHTGPHAPCTDTP